MKDEDEAPEPEEDPDRTAILSRRRKLVALALAGLTSAAACGDGGAAEPSVCLSAPIDRVETRGGPGDQGHEQRHEGQGGDQPPPMPCLSPPRPDPRDPEVTPTPCLTPVRPEPCLDMPFPQEDPASDETDEVEPEPERARPQVCLRIAPPRRDDSNEG